MPSYLIAVAPHCTDHSRTSCANTVALTILCHYDCLTSPTVQPNIASFCLLRLSDCITFCFIALLRLSYYDCLTLLITIASNNCQIALLRFPRFAYYDCQFAYYVPQFAYQSFPNQLCQYGRLNDCHFVYYDCLHNACIEA